MNHAELTVAVLGVVAVFTVIVGIWLQSRHRGRMAQDARIARDEALQKLKHVEAEYAAGRLSDEELAKKVNEIVARRRRRLDGSGDGGNA
ncbi:MAG TPA: hypothetical protein VEA38_19215 [Terriglobales bacterium]|nr:hypothetical protein [Terriglobales bacterium]